MAYINALSAYKETRVKTAGQGQLVVMLYDEAVKQLDRGLELMKENSKGKKDPAKIEEIAKSLLKTQEIITELMVSLDFDQGGEIARNLFSLYTWFNHEIVEANVTKDASRVTKIRNMMHDLRSAWGEIVSKTSTEHIEVPKNGVNIAG